ncbi:unnamed protein product, partial [Prorocentrum cordatum]
PVWLKRAWIELWPEAAAARLAAAVAARRGDRPAAARSALGVPCGGAVGLSRWEVAADRVFRTLQLRVRDLGRLAGARGEVEGRSGGPARVTQDLPRLVRLPELGLPVELALASGFFAPVCADQPTLGFHLTIPQDAHGGLTAP